MDEFIDEPSVIGNDSALKDIGRNFLPLPVKVIGTVKTNGPSKDLLSLLSIHPVIAERLGLKQVDCRRKADKENEHLLSKARVMLDEMRGI